MKDSLLEVDDLYVSFRQHHKTTQAVRGVSFEILPKESIGIVGESGSGKSVMVRAILRLLSSPSVYQYAKSITYQDVDLCKLSERAMQKIRGKEIGMIFQDPMSSLNPTMKVGEQILEALKEHEPTLSHQYAKEKVLQILRLVGIPEVELRYHQYPHELSGGMRQRIMIAIALAPSPKILIADEPTTALDVTIQAQILDLLKDIQAKTESSVILITHDLSIVARFCDKVMVMYAGQIVETGSVEDIFLRPGHPYTKKLLKAIPRLDRNVANRLETIEGSPPNLSQPIRGCSFCQRCDHPMSICMDTPPPLFQVKMHHKAACFMHDKRAERLKAEVGL